MGNDVILQGYIEVPKGSLDAVLRELPIHIRLTLQEQGCLEFEVAQMPDNPCRFSVYERFKDRASFEAHQLRTADSKWAKITGAATRDYRVT